MTAKNPPEQAPGDWKAVLRLVWAAITIVTTLLVATPFLVPEAALARVVPECESKRLFGRPCVLCGATTGFYALSRGELSEAQRANALAGPLFALFTVNAAVAAAYWWRRARRTADAETGNRLD